MRKALSILLVGLGIAGFYIASQVFVTTLHEDERVGALAGSGDYIWVVLTAVFFAGFIAAPSALAVVIGAAVWPREKRNAGGE